MEAQEHVSIRKEDGSTKTVPVKALDWKGVKAFIGALQAANIPLPEFSVGSIGSWIDDARAQYAAMDVADDSDAALLRAAVYQQQTNLGMYKVLVELLADNVQVLYQWVLKHPPIASALVSGATGLTHEEIDGLSAGAFMKAVRASWKALVDDGFFAEVGSFFGELLPLNVSQAGAQILGGTQNVPASPTNSPESADASKSASPAPPAGV